MNSIGVFFFAIALGLTAQEPASLIGVMRLQGPAIPGATQKRVRAVPFVEMETQALRAGMARIGTGFLAGFTLLRQGPWRVELQGELLEGRNESQARCLAGMGSRSEEVYLAPTTSLQLGHWRTTARLTFGLSGGSGALGSVDLRWRINPRKGLQLSLELEIMAANRSALNHQFGVNEEQAVRRAKLVRQGDDRLSQEELGVCHVAGGLAHMRLKGMMAISWSPHCGFLAIVSLDHLGVHPRKSPLVRESRQSTFGLGSFMRW